MSAPDFNSGDSSVSPVIATILMVSITVILAAIIATVIMGMSSNIPHTKAVTGTVSQKYANLIVITYHGGQDQKTCSGIRWDITASDGSEQMTIMGSTSLSSGTQLNVGTEKTITGNFEGRDHIIATAFFMDGTQQVILDVVI